MLVYVYMLAKVYRSFKHAKKMDGMRTERIWSNDEINFDYFLKVMNLFLIVT